MQCGICHICFGLYCKYNREKSFLDLYIDYNKYQYGPYIAGSHIMRTEELEFFYECLKLKTIIFGERRKNK